MSCAPWQVAPVFRQGVERLGRGMERLRRVRSAFRGPRAASPGARFAGSFKQK